MYYETYNKSFQKKKKFKSIQFNAALAITVAIRGSSKKKIDLEIGLRILISKSRYPNFPYKVILKPISSYGTRQCNKTPVISTKYDYIKNTFFPANIIEGNMLYPKMEISECIGVFRKRILTFI